MTKIKITHETVKFVKENFIESQLCPSAGQCLETAL